MDGIIRHQLPVEFLDQLVHLIAEELVHFAETALGIEGGVVEVVAFEAEGGDDVVALCAGRWLTHRVKTRISLHFQRSQDSRTRPQKTPQLIELRGLRVVHPEELESPTF